MTLRYKSMVQPASSSVGLVLVEDDQFLRSVKAGVRQMRRSTDVNPHQRRLLDDLGRGRYLNGLRQFCDMGRSQTASAADAVALFDLLKAYVLEGHATDWTIREAYSLETFSNYELNDAQDAHALAPSGATIDGLVEKSASQVVATSILKHVAVRQRPALVGGR